MAEDFTSLLIAVGILLIPVVLALPLRFWWTYRVGSEPEHVRYRRWVRQVLDAGEPLSTRRKELDHLARGLPIDTSRQGRIEMDVLHPLKLPHFMLLPVLILSPLVGLIGAILFVLLFPLILAAEWLLIDRGLLSKIVNIVMRVMHWGIIGIHRLDTGVRDEDAMVEHMHRLPTTAFLGLFCYLIVSYMPLPTWVGITLTILLFLILTSVIVIVKAASHGELVFADSSQRRMQPMESTSVPNSDWRQQFHLRRSNLVCRDCPNCLVQCRRSRNHGRDFFLWPSLRTCSHGLSESNG